MSGMAEAAQRKTIAVLALAPRTAVEEWRGQNNVMEPTAWMSARNQLGLRSARCAPLPPPPQDRVIVWPPLRTCDASTPAMIYARIPPMAAIATAATAIFSL